MSELIKKYEGCKLAAYKCAAGVWTIGWGSTFYQDGRPVKQGDKITQDEADKLLDWYIKNKIKVPVGLNKTQTEAVRSLIYNIGQSAFDKSTLKKAIESKDWKAVFNNWNWITGGGQFLKGLAKRRAEELMLFFS